MVAMTTARAVLLSIAAMLASGASAAANAPLATVYKCFAADGSVIYQDYACRGGSRVDIKADAVDPRAVLRLQEAQAAFERRAAERNANATAETLRREELAARERELDAAQRNSERKRP